MESTPATMSVDLKKWQVILAIVVSIGTFSGGWVTLKEDDKRSEVRIDKNEVRIDKVEQRMDRFDDKMDARFDKVMDKLDVIEEKLSNKQDRK